MQLSDFTFRNALSSADDDQRHQALVQAAQGRIQAQQQNDSDRNLAAALGAAHEEYNQGVKARAAAKGETPGLLFHLADVPPVDINARGAEIAQDAENNARRQGMIDRANARDAAAKVDAEAAVSLDPLTKTRLDNAGVSADDFIRLREQSKNLDTNAQAYQGLQTLIAPLVGQFNNTGDRKFLTQAAAIMATAGAEFAEYRAQPTAPTNTTPFGTLTPGSVVDVTGSQGTEAPLAAGVTPPPGGGYARTADGRQFVVQDGKFSQGTYDPSNPNTTPFTPPVPPHRADILAGNIPEQPTAGPQRGTFIPRAINAGIEAAAPVAAAVQHPISTLQRAVDATAPVASSIQHPGTTLDAAGNAIRGAAAPAVGAGMQAAGAAGDAAGSFLQERIQMAKDLAQRLYGQGIHPTDIYHRLASHFPDLANQPAG